MIAKSPAVSFAGSVTLTSSAALAQLGSIARSASWNCRQRDRIRAGRGRRTGDAADLGEPLQRRVELIRLERLVHAPRIARGERLAVARDRAGAVHHLVAARASASPARPACPTGRRCASAGRACSRSRAARAARAAGRAAAAACRCFTASAAIVPAAWPVSIVIGWRRVAPLAMRDCEMFFSAGTKPSIFSGMKTSNGTWNGPPPLGLSCVVEVRSRSRARSCRGRGP